MSFLDRIKACSAPDLVGFRPFRVCGAEVGYMKRAFADILREYPDVFRVGPRAVDLHERLCTFEERTAAVDGVLRDLAAHGVVRRWRDEPYPVSKTYSAPALLYMERAAAALFGIRGYGIHMNGFVRDGGEMKMWIARRALDKATAPGKWDQMVAGGQPATLSLMDNLVKECDEEAGIPADLAAKAVPIGAVTYRVERPEGLRRDTLFNYDLELPPDFVPRPVDGEVEDFHLWPLDRVIETVRETDTFKFNCSLVVIDFLIRHGILGPEEPDYLELLEGLHQPLG